MAEIQQFFTQWVGDISRLIPLGYAFGAGMVAAVNPCGFAMLPAYLGLFLGRRERVLAPATGAPYSGIEQAAVAVPTQVVNAALVAATVTGGFVLFYGGVGVLMSVLRHFIITLIPWIAVGIGGALVVLGLAMLSGRHISANFAARIGNRIGDPGNVSARGFFVFGVAFAAASLSCTLPIFLTVVGGSLTVSGFASSVVQFVSYSLGMGLVVLTLTIGIALFKGAVVGGLRRAVPYVERVSALLVVTAGSYIVYYWLVKGDLL